MGMYTHYALHVEFRKDTPPEFIERVRRQVEGDSDDDDLFPLSRAGAAYQVSASPLLTCPYGEWTLTVMGSVKYGTGAIENLVKVLAPHIQTYSPGFCGWMQYEEDDHPTLLYVHDGKVTWVPAAKPRSTEVNDV
jgi:hypothetical protein